MSRVPAHPLQYLSVTGVLVCRIRGPLAVLVLLLAGGISPAVGQEAPGSAASGLGEWATRGVWAAFGELGSSSYETTSRLPGLEGGGTWGLGLGFHPGSPFPGHVLRLDFRAWGAQGSFPSLVEGAAEARTELTNRAFAFGARLGLPPSWPVGVGVQGGVAYLEHIMRVEGLPAWFLPGLDQEWEEDDAGWTPYWGVTAEARIRSVGIGVEKRWMSASRTFDPPFALDDVQLDGSALLLTVTWYMGR